MTISEPNEDSQYILEFENQRSNNKNEEEDELVQGERKHFYYFTLKYHMFFISCLF
jgi:hypothetical protein